MNIVIAIKSAKPIYEQIYDQIAAQILSGELTANYCLPSIRVVAKELNISIITVKKAWENLETNGFIFTRAAVGCFVSDNGKANLQNKKRQLAEEKLQQNLPYYKELGISKDELLDMINKLY